MSNELVKVSAQHIQKHDIEANWLKAINFTPYKGQIIIYDSEFDKDNNILDLPEGRLSPYSYARFKIGDGIHNINDLPFANSPEAVGLVTNESNALIQESNQAYGAYSSSLGNNNINLSQNSITQGLLNISGVMFNDSIECSVISSEITPDNLAAITVENLGSDALTIDDHIVIFASDYWFSCKVVSIENTDTYSIINVLNHNVSKPINDAKDKSTVKIYKVADTNVSESCHTEHVEGAYNISAATGDGATSSRVSHIEGHTNISFGQYNHVEGIRNRALDQTEMTHIEGRFNTVQEGKNVSVHVEGERNTINNSSYLHVGGYNNKINNSNHTFTQGYSNEVSDSPNAVTFGRSNSVINAQKSVVIGENLEKIKESQIVIGKFNSESEDAIFVVANGQDTKNRDNALEILKDGTFRYKNESNELVSLNDVHQKLNQELQDLQFKLSEKLSVENNFSMYLIDPYDYRYISAEGASSIDIVSRNELNNIYIYGSTSSGTKNLCGLDFTNDDGKVIISGNYKSGSGWPQYYLHRKDINRLELQPNETYLIGLMYDETETRRVNLKFSYVDDGFTINTSTSDTSPIEIEWTDVSELNSLYIQASQSDYIESLNVYPYIINKDLVEAGKDLTTWIPYKKISYINPKAIIEIPDLVDGSITFRSESSGEIKFYERLNFATTDYVDNKITGIDLSNYATKTYVDESIENIKLPSIEDLATEEYVDEAISKINIPSLDGYATEQYVDDSIAEINSKLDLNKFEQIENISLNSSIDPKGRYNSITYSFNDNNVEAVKIDSSNNISKIITYNSRNILNSYYVVENYQQQINGKGSGLIWTSSKDEGIVTLSGTPVVSHWPQGLLFNYASSSRLNLCPGTEYIFGVLCPETDIMNIKMEYYEYSQDGSRTKITLSTSRNKGIDSFSILWKDNYVIERIFLQANKDTSYDNLVIYPYMTIGSPIESIEDWDIYSELNNFQNTSDIIYKPETSIYPLAVICPQNDTNEASITFNQYISKDYVSKESLDNFKKEITYEVEDFESATLKNFSIISTGISVTVPANVSKYSKINKLEFSSKYEPRDIYLRLTDLIPKYEETLDLITETTDGITEFNISPMTSYYWEPFDIEAGDYYVSFEIISGSERLGSLGFYITDPITDYPMNSDWYFNMGTSNSIHLDTPGKLVFMIHGQGQDHEDLYGKIAFKFYITKGSSKPDYIVKDSKITSIASYNSYSLINSIEIPEAVQTIDGYGRKGSKLEWLEDKSIKLTVSKNYELNDLDYPITYDVTKDFTSSNMLDIESATDIRFISEYNLPVISTMSYKKNIMHDVLSQKLASKVDKLNKSDVLYGTQSAGRDTWYSFNATQATPYSFPKRNNKGDLIVPDNPGSENAATSKKYVTSEINNVNAITSDIESRVSNLENLTLSYHEITSTDYEKAVPADVGEPARIKMIGSSTERMVSKNLINPQTIEVVGRPSGNTISKTVNADGSITFTVNYKVDRDLGANITIWFNSFPEGKYYYLVEGADNIYMYDNYLDIEYNLMFGMDDYEDEGTFTTKIMVYKYEDSDIVEFTEAPEGTVFEPYISGFRDAEVERIESYGKNLANPKDISPFTYYVSNEAVPHTVNADGSISITLYSEKASGAELWTNFGLNAGKYYYLVEGADSIYNLNDSINIMCDIPYDRVQGYPDSADFNVKIMVYKYEDSDTLEFSPAPLGTVFEPYKDGDSIAIPFEAIKAKIDGFGKPVNDIYYDYIEFVDDKVFGYKVANERVLNGTEDWKKHSASTLQTPYFYIISDKQLISNICLCDAYERVALSVANSLIGVNVANLAASQGKSCILVRPVDCTTMTVDDFKEQLAKKPITVRVALTTPKVTDITDLFTEGNKLQVQRGGAIRFVNEKKMAIPNTVAFIKRKE